eukprot:jgi/Galph1/1833/GphlegSOOS_G512.1
MFEQGIRQRHPAESHHDSFQETNDTDSSYCSDEADIALPDSLDSKSVAENNPVEKKYHDTGKVKMGILPSGEKFLVPPLPDMMEALLKPSLWTVFEIISNLCTLTLGYCFFFAPQLPVGFYQLIFLFWRIAYNLFLGVLLKLQSKKSIGVTLFKGLSRSEQAIWKNLIRKRIPIAWEKEECPDELWSWLIFRGIATIILANDGVSFFFLALKSFELPNAFTWKVILCYSLGVSLLIFCFWSKVSAHRCIGDYAWFWGDFFFRIEGELVFDGVFELFPHPMYTIGYAAYYGCCLIAQSYRLLFLSLFSHGSQLLFLMLVEEPHIQRLYSRRDENSPGTQQWNSLVHSDYNCSRNELTGLLHLYPLRSTDFAVVVLLVYLLLFSLFSSAGKVVYIIQVIVWRCFHWIGFGYLLYLQSRYRFITKQAQSRGYTMEEAFIEWRRLYNFSLVINHAVFIAAAFRFWIADYQLTGSFVENLPALVRLIRNNLFSSSKWATFLGGTIFILLSVYGSMSSYMAIGDYGWYYGDFFFEPKTDSPVYTGIYRFMNNPDCILGHLWMYGVAMIGRNWEIFWLAILCQASNVLFLHLVESPHINRCYSQRREAAALEVKFRRGAARVASAPLVRNLTTALKLRAKKERERIRDRARKRRIELSHQATKMKLKVLYARQESKAALKRAADDVRRWNRLIHQHELYTKIVESLQRMIGEEKSMIVKDE